MKKHNQLIIFLLILCLLILSLSGCVSKSDFEALQADYQLMQDEKVSLEIIVEQNSRDLEDKDKRIGEIENEMESIKDELISTQLELDLSQQQYRDALDEIVLYKEEVSSYLEELKLYKDTFGSVVQSGRQPKYRGVYLHNNHTATDPAFDELENFLLEDKTDRNDYIDNVYMCGDFANDVHDNAEQAGIRSGWVAILIENDDGYSSYHACNVFKTTDKGLIYIDCTGSYAGERRPPNSDTRVNVQLDIPYKPRFMFATRWRMESLGIIRDIEIYW